MKKVRAILNYKDKELERDVMVGEILEVTEERAEVLLKGNKSSGNKPFVELVVKEQGETTEELVEEPTEEKAVKPKAKKTKAKEEAEEK